MCQCDDVTVGQFDVDCVDANLFVCVWGGLSYVLSCDFGIGNESGG